MITFDEMLISESRSELIPEEYDYFGEFIGAWDVSCDYDYGEDNKGHCTGEWVFSWILKGTAIQDVYTLPEWNKAKAGDEIGTTVRFFDPVKKVWHIFYGWLNYTAQLEAVKEGNEVILTEISERKMKWIFSEIKKESFHWQNLSTQDGEHWVVNWDIHATRKTK